MHAAFVLRVLLQLIFLLLDLIGIVAEVVMLRCLRFQIVSVVEAGQIIECVVQPVIVIKQVSQQSEYFVL